MSNIIEVKNLTFRYKQDQERYTLDDVTFHVKQGEWLSIIGHNGSGKSTVVRLIDGLLKAEAGQIFVDGDLLTEENVWDIRHKIGMVFQNPDNQFVGATVEDDVAFGLENKGVSHQEMIDRVYQALQLVGMEAFKDKEPSRLSGGQKQRVAIAGAVAMRPMIIILDEATSMLDPKGRLELIRTIQSIRQEYQLTVISITHDLDEVALSDRALVMNNGRVESVSTPQELFARGNQLINLGLDIPFTTSVVNMLKEDGFPIQGAYLTEKELEEQLCQFISKM
ncbi:TPA: energy-coupling factor transporter ATPase [Streptococcus equi subsp. zooepidemicus]|uniref:energy-coupling factor ABC transporter ATP-binding protein n=1 Tax=Streptococcus equi TaxID=1336 RepID=UPI00021749D3|nr:energy-coupling factor ABC transporter ATP-binding protein [Streptococcus equi]AEJ26300.1 ABC transporter ATP-binding protein [Streptococcus equi subsp. zooepidemicus ATCC 35246]AIA68346.1 cobalt ABC transporter ATP-binding protein [Streptococcus equi subsp. zooepidemicus CY]KIQ76503.1 cobalt transporter ATP-binding subunit [Streptococcus equi subsp. zooepidemicus]MBR7683217.1 energy-coupling factor transporter ATPase [Streptococcus equi subsp. zooepidemicus]MBR7752929.1 energy-coupling fac